MLASENRHRAAPDDEHNANWMGVANKARGAWALAWVSAILVLVAMVLISIHTESFSFPPRSHGATPFERADFLVHGLGGIATAFYFLGLVAAVMAIRQGVQSMRRVREDRGGDLAALAICLGVEAAEIAVLIGSYVLMFEIFAQYAPPPFDLFPFLVVVSLPVTAGVGLALGIAAYRAVPHGQHSGRWLPLTLAAANPAVFVVALEVAAVVTFSLGMGTGRPLRIGRRLVRTPVVAGHAWRMPVRANTNDLPPNVRHTLAEEWLADARMEHASVAAFSQLALDLLAAGAPPELLSQAHRAALDEVRHAQICFSLASFYAKEDLGPGPLVQHMASGGIPRPLERTVLIAKLASESLVDGCLNEGLASAMAYEGATLATDAAVQRTLVGIAADERRHCELAWEIVAWCLDEGRIEVTSTVRSTLEELNSRRWLPIKVHPASDGSLSAYGRVGDAWLRDQYVSTLQEVLDRATAMLLSDLRRDAIP